MGIPAILIAYLIGALPMGYFSVRALRGKDITQSGSGRTGGTNAMRAGGFWVGLLTSGLDIAKGFSAVWIAKLWFPESIWVHVLAAVAVVLGHNWSIWLYLSHRRMWAGAGAGPNVGAAIAFWPALAFLLIPVGAVTLFVIGYASLTTLILALLIPLGLYGHHLWAGSPWEYSLYGVLTAVLATLALRPNLQRLVQGKERRVGLFARSRTGAEGQ